MATSAERNWTAHVVIASDHGGLKPVFIEFETELLRVLARVDEPRDVAKYLHVLHAASRGWFHTYQAQLPDRPRREIGGRVSTDDRARGSAKDK